MLPSPITALIDTGAVTRGATGLKARSKPAHRALVSLLNRPKDENALATGIHVLQASGTAAMPSASGFTAALLTRFGFAERTIVWLTQGLTEREWGDPSALGLQRIGLDPSRILYVRSRTVADFLWSLEQAVTTQGVACVVAETPDEAAFGLTETRRIALKSAHSGVPCYLLAPNLSKNKNATNASTRWMIAPASSGGENGLLGDPAWQLRIEKNRSGPCTTGTAAFSPSTKRFVVPDAKAPPAPNWEEAPAPLRPDTAIGPAVVHLSSIRRQKFELAKERS